MKLKGLLFGPWVGEFGWELFSWQGYMRSVAKRFDIVVAAGRESSQALYTDFAHFYIPHEPTGEPESYLNSAAGVFDHMVVSQIPVDHDNVDWHWVKPHQIGSPPYDHPLTPVNINAVGEIVPSYKLFGNAGKEGFDVAFHCRDRGIRNHENWPIENWKNLANECSKSGLTVTCVGTTESSMYIEGTVDKRGTSLQDTMDTLRNSRVIIGSSSGPMHLASLCGCPQIWWTSNPNKNIPRYYKMWNPFNTKSRIVDGTVPDVESVTKEMRLLLGG